jgi:hypothetical protein
MPNDKHAGNHCKAASFTRPVKVATRERWQQVLASSSEMNVATYMFSSQD